MPFSAPFYYTDKYKVYSYHTDFKQRLQLTSLLHFLQETAGNHASANGFGFDALGAAGHFWVLSRLKLEVLRYPKWKEELALRTWSKAPEALMGIRDFELIDGQGAVVAIASTAWLMVDINTRRPLRLEAFASQFPHVNDRHAFAQAPEKLEATPLDKPLPALEIRCSDVDMNGHVNNACYVRWVLDSLPDLVQECKEIKTLEVNFLHESRAKQHYSVCLQQVNESCYTAGVLRTEDAKELARLRITL